VRCVVQRSGPAQVEVDGKITGAIDHGLVVLVGFAPGDSGAEMQWMARKLVGLRIFKDSDELMNLSLQDTGGGILLVSQFTLYGDCRKGRRPSFVKSAPPAAAKIMYEDFGRILRAEGAAVSEGVFGAMMSVSLTNDGPVTLILDRDAKNDE
jgi:D-tyrosyl-tRNA(Tyr) deacylase